MGYQGIALMLQKSKVIFPDTNEFEYCVILLIEKKVSNCEYDESFLFCPQYYEE